jgi:hypothetical protein
MRSKVICHNRNYSLYRTAFFLIRLLIYVSHIFLTTICLLPLGWWCDLFSGMGGSIMKQVCHGSATTTFAVRAAIQRWQASISKQSRELGINPKTVAKWRKRKTGPREPRSTVLSQAEEGMIVAFRRHTQLSLNDCLYALQPSIPHLTRSALHRCLQRRGISRLPNVAGD